MLPRRSALVVCQVIRRQYSESERTKFDWKKISFDLMREIINEKEKSIIHWQSQVSQQNGIDGQLSTKTSLELMREIINEKDKNINDKERLIKSQQNAFDGQLSGVRQKLKAMEDELLRLRGNFNLRGALEFSLDDYSTLKQLKSTSKPEILEHLIHDPLYEKCLTDVLLRYQLRKVDVNSCTKVLYHELSKHGHGNTSELSVIDTEHTMTEVAAIEAVFCALKKHDCFHLPIKVVVGQKERFLD